MSIERGSSTPRTRSARKTIEPFQDADEDRRTPGVIGGELDPELGHPGLDLLLGEEDLLDVGVNRPATASVTEFRSPGPALL
jgi:hypothetical protein